MGVKNSRTRSSARTANSTEDGHQTGDEADAPDERRTQIGQTFLEPSHQGCGELVDGRHELLAGERGGVLRHSVDAYGRRLGEAGEDDAIHLSVRGPCQGRAERA